MSDEMKTTEPDVQQFIRMFKCDTARISQPGGRMFLILGWNKNTKTEREAGREAGQWHRDGEPIDFDYVHEQVVASGNSESELMESAKLYQQLCAMTWEQFFAAPREFQDRVFPRDA